MTVVVRTAAATDVPVIAAMRRAWTEEYVGAPVDDPGFAADFAAWFDAEADQRVTWLARVGGCDVGMLNMLIFTRMPRPRRGADDRPTEWGYVANVYVEPPHRDAGTGRRLLDAATQYAEQHGFARIVLSPSERSLPFYTRAGFVPATSLLIRVL